MLIMLSMLRDLALVLLNGLVLLVSGCVLNAHALSDRASTPQVQAQLVASVAAVHPGSEIYLGLHQKIIPHWHTYWVNPGDSGSATTITWTLPDGASASDILWPAPSRFSMGPITNYAYGNEVTLLTKVQVPPTAVPGQVFSVQAVVDWLVCEEECIPQQVELALDLPIVAPQSALGEGSPYIGTALARLPIESPWPVRVYPSEPSLNELKIHLALPEAMVAQISDIWFYPYEWGVIQQSVQQTYRPVAQGLELTLKTGEAPLGLGDQLKGVLVIAEQTGQGSSGEGADEVIARGYEVSARIEPAAPVSMGGDPVMSLLGALGLALLGGVILNLMPCVFPVLSIKALSLISHSHQSAGQVRLHGMVYTLGVLASFALLASLLIVLKAGGAQIGWGFQFQSPLFVLAVAYLLFAVGLSLSGVFFIGGSVAGVGASLAQKPGYMGSFFTGVLATIVATPCTAPFMAAALGYALAQPAPHLLAVLLSLGLGLALPYLLLTSWPRLQRWLPRPGLWMEHTKQFLAFPMYATAVWLVWVLVQQVGAQAVLVALGGMLMIAFAAWLYNQSRTATPRSRYLANAMVTAAMAVALVGGYVGVNHAVNDAQQQSNDVSNSNLSDSNLSNNNLSDSKHPERYWEPYSEARLQSLLNKGKPVFLNFTASWCISCLVNERVALSDASVIAHFKNQGVVYLKGDWTNRDPSITAFLQKFNRSGVPLYVFYPAGRADSPQQLPQILTPDIVKSVVKH